MKESQTNRWSQSATKYVASGSACCWTQMMQMKFNFRSYLTIADTMSTAFVTTVVTKIKFSVNPLLALL
jgi:hypothetical protein